MFVTVKRHYHELSTLGQQYEARISDLKDQIADLRKLVFMPPTPVAIPYQALEADAVLSVSERPVVSLSPEDDEKLDFLASEANRILSGSYDEVDMVEGGLS